VTDTSAQTIVAVIKDCLLHLNLQLNPDVEDSVMMLLGLWQDQRAELLAKFCQRNAKLCMHIAMDTL